VGIKLVFASKSLDEKNWVMDFGGLAAFKSWARYTFDHTLLVAIDDPQLELFKSMASLGLNDRGGVCDLRVVKNVGCEAFAEMAFEEMNKILVAYQLGNTYTSPTGETFSARYLLNLSVELQSAEVYEHAGNSAIYTA